MVAKADGGSGSPWIATDYSCYSLDDIWASVNQSDTQTWPQIDAWNTMASVCAEQAGQLKLALAQLMQRWVPTSGSAAEAFATTVNNLIAAMQRDATAAPGMPPVLTQIVSAMSDTKDKLQTVIDQRDHFEAVEQAQLTNPMAMRFAPANSPLVALRAEPVPDNWRQDLRAQAVDIMHAGDANLGTITAQMPTLAEANVGELEQLKIVEPPRNSKTTGNESVGSPAMDVRSRLSGLTTPNNAVAGGSLSMPLDADSEPAPVLAGGVLPTNGSPPTVGVDPGLPTTGSPSRPTIQRSSGPLGPVGHVVGAAPGALIGAAPDAATDLGNAAKTGPSQSIMAPPSGSQIRSGAQQRGVRPAGRAALWASQRKRKSSSSDDPWAVPTGVPPVIEPEEPQDHEPGPGVIGLDR